jgi:hypothetical protein
MGISTAYSFLNVSATIDRRDVIGGWDGDDAIVVTPGADAGTGLIGANGDGIFSISADQSASISVKLMHTSPTHELLHKKWKQQRARGANASAFSFVIKDKVSGEGYTADKCYIMSAPETSHGKNATVREWILWTASAVPEVPNNG